VLLTVKNSFKLQKIIYYKTLTETFMQRNKGQECMGRFFAQTEVHHWLIIQKILISNIPKLQLQIQLEFIKGRKFKTKNHSQ